MTTPTELWDSVVVAQLLLGLSMFILYLYKLHTWSHSLSKGDIVAYQSWNTGCKFEGCSVYLRAGQGHFVRDPQPRALCDKHYAEVQQMRKNLRRKKRIAAAQPQLDLST
jgi:hypothetical protein